ncbi:MAG: CDP-diacylglycerol--serine O-phosphatidyltransferase [Candidatus Hydrogenedentes bacterium]|nr:CDP-diacylglycerol--serine O-phosphatidyltransferase [Candidatus Hydrogenedentota bacterium]
MKKLRRMRLRHARRRRPVNFLASIMTLMNLYMGIVSIFASIGLELEKAAYFILFGIIFDMLDGFVARLTKSNSEFGKELDSLCDVVTFGLAPAILVFVSYLPATTNFLMSPQTESLVGKTGSYIAIFFAVCAALRLARYNTFQAGRQDFFTGLPSPAAGGTVASFVLLLQYFETSLEASEKGILAYYALGPLAALLAYLMVSTVRYPRNRLKSFTVSPRHAFRALGIFAVVLIVLHYALTKHWSIVLFPLGMTYVLFGIVDTLYHRLLRRGQEKPEAESESKPLQRPEPPGGAVSKTGDFL